MITVTDRLRRHRWLLTGLLCALALCSGTLAASAASSRPATGAHPADTPPPTQTLTVVGKRGAFSLPDTPAVGLPFIAGGALYDSTGANQVGQAYSNCTVAAVSVAVPPAITAECTTVFALSGGDIYLGSLRTYTGGGFSDTTLAIIGGAGDYRTARGDGTVSETDTVAHSYTFTLNITNS
ncbi:MAG TPA: hypothetical protein VHW44_11180 [Pseudonocardiaceae bacterium]|nr:hypothetical protein [Pseudonocardiaceae bacterium]